MLSRSQYLSGLVTGWFTHSVGDRAQGEENKILSGHFCEKH